MTVIAYVKTKDQIYLGSDSLASGHVDYSEFGEKMFLKPFEFFENEKYSDIHYFVVAFAGEVGIKEFFQHGFNIPTWNLDVTESFKEYIVATMLPSFGTQLKNAGLLKRDKDDRYDSGIQFYIIYKNEVIEVQRDLTIFVSGLDYGAIGSGASVCMGALDYSRKQIAKPKNRLKRCIDTASRLVPSVGGKTVIDTIKDSDYLPR